jgi:hypothetical protein
MDRLTKWSGPGGQATVDAGRIVLDGGVATGDAVERLARFEDVCGELVADQVDVARQLVRLRGEGRAKTVQFRELMARKLTNQYLLILLEKHGIA